MTNLVATYLRQVRFGIIHTGQYAYWITVLFLLLCLYGAWFHYGEIGIIVIGFFASYWLEILVTWVSSPFIVLLFLSFLHNATWESEYPTFGTNDVKRAFRYAFLFLLGPAYLVHWFCILPLTVFILTPVFRGISILGSKIPALLDKTVDRVLP